MWKIILCFILSPVLVFPDYIQNWNGLLKDYTTLAKKEEIITVLLDYDGIRGDGRWYSLLEDLEKNNPQSLKGDYLKAFWINVYNIGAVKVVLDNHPLKSIKDAGSIINPVWNKEAININGRFYSLGFIEHEILRKTGDPLIHYAIVCASLSCPDIRDKAYTGDGLEEQMKNQRTSFLSNPTKGMRSEGNTLFISMIYKWYEEDFGDIYEYLMVPRDKKIKYMDYNWSLNGIN